MNAFRSKPGVAFFCGFVHAIAFVFASVPWIAEVWQCNGGMSRLGGWHLMLIAMTWGFLPGGFSWTVSDLSPKRPVGCTAAPFVWVTSELPVHTYRKSASLDLLGFRGGECRAGTNNHAHGIYGLSFLVAAFNALLAWADAAKRSQPKERLGIIAASLVIILGADIAGGRFVPEAKNRPFRSRGAAEFSETDSYPPQLVRTSQRGHGRAGFN